MNKTNSEQVIQAIAGSPDWPVVIGDLEIPCYVLEDERGVLAQRGMVSALGLSRGSSGGTGGDRLAKFVAGKRLSEYVTPELKAVTGNPIKFKTPNGSIAYGYDATILADICEAVLTARDNGKLQSQQQDIAKQCEILMRGFARIGILALVYEATGYDKIKARGTLENILKRYIAADLQKWVKTFPDEFYTEMFRLRGWNYGDISRRPGVAGRLTVDLIYKRLAPGVLEELKRQTPRDDSGRLRQRLHQRLTVDYGHPRLREHLAAVIALMKASTKWRNFYAMINRALPKYDATLPMLLGFDEEEYGEDA
jgi:hypothetical protein